MDGQDLFLHSRTLYAIIPASTSPQKDRAWLEDRPEGNDAIYRPGQAAFTYDDWRPSPGGKAFMSPGERSLLTL